MNLKTLKSEIAKGEDSIRQFKENIHNSESLAAEIVAFANADGGTIFIGIGDDGTAKGLDLAEVQRINQLVSNTASQWVRSPVLVKTQNIVLENNKLIIVLEVPAGLDKPYFDKNGVIWFKNGSDKRRINSKEELRRLFQVTDQIHADEMPTRAGIDKLDKLRLRDFLESVYQIRSYPESEADLVRILQNLNLAGQDGMLNLAGVLLFAQYPERIRPQFVVKAIQYPGLDVHLDTYEDTEDFAGPFPRVFEQAMGFIMRNLHKVQAGRGVNSPGTPEVPEAVFEELLVNALVHRDYFISAPIRIFIYSDRIEIVSPGHLPNHLTVPKICAGNSNIRNPILVSFVAKGLLPYHGLGSGIQRALKFWPHIEFVDDREGCLFTARVFRQPEDKRVVNGDDLADKEIKILRNDIDLAAYMPKLGEKEDGNWRESGGLAEKVLTQMQNNPLITTVEVAQNMGVGIRSVERCIAKLKQSGQLKRVGGRKAGYWQVENLKK